MGKAKLTGARPPRIALVDFLEQRVLLSTTVAPLQSQTRVCSPPIHITRTVSAPLSSTTTAAPSATLGAPYSPATIRHAYGVDAISFQGATGNGAGQTIAIVDAYNDPNIISDASSFNSTFSLPQFNQSGGPTLQVLNESGGTSLSGVPNSAVGTWDVEESLDVEWAHAIAPDANIILFEANSNGIGDLLAAARQAADTAGVSVVSMSWGVAEFSGETAYDSYLAQPAGHQSVTFLAATGDTGTPSEYPAYSPDVLAVGGTSLTVNSDSSYNSETGWADGGGGVSTQEPLPSYQVGKINGVSSTNRAAPDVAMDADSNTGVYVLDTDYSSSYLQVGGTSLATPMWAGLVALADQGRALAGLSTLAGTSQTLPALYGLPSSDFHDITTGSNGNSAQPGYDLVTGLGSPVANLLVPGLAAYGVSGPTVTTNPVSQIAAAGSNVTFTAAATGSPTVQWEESTNSGASFSPITGNSSATTDSLQLLNVQASQSGDEFKAEFTNSASSVFTSTATLTVTASTSPGTTDSLTGSAQAAAASYNLTSLGTSDWAHWGRGGNSANFDHDSSGGSQISNITKVGSGNYGGFSSSPRDVIWTNGAPTASNAGDHGYIWANDALGAGYSFTVPASSTSRTLSVYLGGASSGGTLVAHLSDDSSLNYSVSFSSSGNYQDLATITYNAASAGQTLTVTYTKSQTIGSASGSVDLIAAWLTGTASAPVSSAPTVTTNPQSQSVTAGAAVSFTAAATGSPAPTVQWELSTNNGASFSPISGATATTLSIGATTVSESGYEYKAVFTNSVSSTTTSAATLTVTSASSSGSITGSSTTAAASYNLTTLGTSDWAHWGRSGNISNFDHDKTGGSQISNVTKVGSGSYGAYTSSARDVIWTNGTPTSSDTGDDGYLWANNAIGAGYSFTVPASTTTHTLSIYLGGYSAGGTVTAHLSDNSAPNYSIAVSSSGNFQDVVTITYHAASAGATLTITYAKSQNIGSASGSVDLMAAWLQ